MFLRFARNARKKVATDAAAFAHELVQAQSHVNECRGIRLFIDEDDGNSEEVNQAKQSGYWQLRVDYKPEMHVQAFTVNGVHGGGPGTQGDGFDAEELMQGVCQLSKDGGAFIYDDDDCGLRNRLGGPGQLR